MGITGIPQSVSELDATVERVLEGVTGAWRTATIPSDRGVIAVCTCGELHSLVVHHLEFFKHECAEYGNALTRVSAELPVTWISSDACLTVSDPLS